MTEGNKSKRRRELRAQARATPEKLLDAATLAVEIMTRGIQSEDEFERILAKARPKSRERIRAMLEPHLTFRRQQVTLT